MDEAGRGAWAGPLTAAAVILPPVAYLDPQLLAGVTDSKRLSPRARERLARLIHARAAAIGVAHTTPQEIDDAGLAAAGRLTMHRALGRLGLDPDHVIVDAFPLDAASPFADRQTAIIRADATCLAVAAASICAKVARDRLMRRLGRSVSRLRLRSQQGLRHSPPPCRVAGAGTDCLAPPELSPPFDRPMPAHTLALAV